MKRILFVDDEPMILEGLRGLLRRYRREWDVVFAGGGEQALTECAQGPFDVVVSDMRMPGMDGATLLKEVQRLYPHTVRIVLSGHMEEEAALRAVPIAHQFLTKPCDADTLRSVIQSACGLQTILENEAIRGLVGGIAELPATPRIFAELSRALADVDRPLADVATILQQDVAMCAKVLQLVNSSFLGLGRRVTSVRDAVVYLGARTLKQLVLSVEAFRVFPNLPALCGLSVEMIQGHSLFVAQIAHRFAGSRSMADDAMAAGMLHDLGLLVLTAKAPKHLEQAVALAKQNKIPLFVAETELFKLTHAEIGAYLLGLWGLPAVLVNAVASHHAPRGAPQGDLSLADTVHWADVVACQVDPWIDFDTPGLTEGGEPVAPVGVESRIPEWRRMAEEIRHDRRPL